MAVHGLNSVELEMNEVATERHVQDPSSIVVHRTTGDLKVLLNGRLNGLLGLTAELSYLWHLWHSVVS